MTNHIDTPFASVAIVPSAPRATAPPAGAQFREAFARAGVGALAALERVVPGMPEGFAATAAMRLDARGSVAGAPAALTPGATPGPESLADRSAQQALELIALQQSIADEQRRFTTVSNVLRARHDLVKNLLGNVR